MNKMKYEYEMSAKLAELLSNTSQEEFNKVWDECVKSEKVTFDQFKDQIENKPKIVKGHIALIGVGNDEKLRIINDSKTDEMSLDAGLVAIDLKDESKKELINDLQKIIELKPAVDFSVPIMIQSLPQMDYEYHEDKRFKNDVWRKKSKKCKGGNFYHK